MTKQLKYAKSHEWVKQEEDGTLTIGITDHAQDQLGDIVYVELPAVNTTKQAQETCMLIESVKAASDIYMPVSGTIVATNTRLEDEPELVNDSPYEEGWLFKIQPDNQAELDGLLTLADYEAELDR